MLNLKVRRGSPSPLPIALRSERERGASYCEILIAPRQCADRAP